MLGLRLRVWGLDFRILGVPTKCSISSPPMPTPTCQECVCERESVCVYAREKERDSVCVLECVYEREHFQPADAHTHLSRVGGFVVWGLRAWGLGFGVSLGSGVRGFEF